LRSADELSTKHGWGPPGYRDAAFFSVDSEVRDYVELETGGNDAFGRMLKEGFYSPYTWDIRHFKEGYQLETHIYFTPLGEPYGFSIDIPENEKGNNIPEDDALRIAKKNAVDVWNLDLSKYKLVEKSQEVRLSGRIDHTFVFERQDIRIGEAFYRYGLAISGDKFTELEHFIKIPESFKRKFTQMRSANKTISSVSAILIALVYGIGCCIFGLLYLLRKHWLVGKKRCGHQ